MRPMAASYSRRLAAAPSAVRPGGCPRPLGLTFCMNMFTNITMLASVPQSGSRPAGSHLVLFDGTCALCTSLVGFVLPRDRVGVFHFASLDSPAGRSVVAQLGGDADDSSTMHVVADHVTLHARHLTRAPAALFVAGTLGWPWKVLALFGALPTTWLNRLYDAV